MSGVTEAGVGGTFIPQNLSSSSVPPSQIPAAAEPSPSPAKVQMPEYTWMVRPCFIYKEEYKDCKSFRARFHQYFVHGETLDCSQWKTDYDNCTDWEQKDNSESLNKLIASERHRVRQRIRSHLANDVWEHRDSPPDDWNKKLPESISKGYEGSYLKKKAEELKRGEEKLGFLGDSDFDAESSCTIM